MKEDIKLINPILIPIINKIPETWADILSLISIGLFSADLAITTSIISDFEDRVERIGEKVDESLENLLSRVLNEEKPFKDKAYKVLYAPRNVKNKIKETKPVSKLATKLKTFRKESYKNAIRRYKKYKEYRKNRETVTQKERKLYQLVKKRKVSNIS